MSYLKKYLSVDWTKNNGSKIILVLVVVLTGVFLYGLNVLYPVYLDDWFYTFSMVDGSRIDSFTSIIHSQYLHYFDWGGRVVLHAIAQALLWFGESWANILNTVAYLVLTLTIYSIVNKGNNTNPIIFIFINIFIWFSLPSLSQNILWTTGSANYLWGGVIVFVFLYFYVSYYFTLKKKDGSVKSLAMFLFGVLAGWTNENMAVALIFFLIVFILLLKYQKKEIPRWMIFGLAGAVIGCVIMLLSPGNAIRSKNDLWVAHKMREMEPSFYFYRFVTVTKLAYQHLLVLFLIYIALFIAFLWKGKSERKRETIYISLLFLCTSAVATIAMSGSPMFPERAWFGIIILLITGAMILYAGIEFRGLASKIINYTLFVAIFIVYIVSCYMNYHDLVKFREVSDRREKIIIEEKEKGTKDIIVTDNFFHQKQSSLTTLDLQDWMMIDPGWDKRLGKYYGVNTVVFKVQE